MVDTQYIDGTYLKKCGGTWHLEDSPWKAQQVLAMLRRHHLSPRSICEIGCGAGGILHSLQQALRDVDFVGYELSPQANALSLPFEKAGCRFVLGDAFADGRAYDLALVMDVIEHVEDCFDFMRKVNQKAAWKIYNIPLDAYVSGILRGSNSWEGGGHIHLFTLETALKSVERAGQEVIDHFFTSGAPVRKNLRDQLRGVAVRLLPPKLGGRVLGGSVLVLAR